MKTIPILLVECRGFEGSYFKRILPETGKLSPYYFSRTANYKATVLLTTAQFIKFREYYQITGSNYEAAALSILEDLKH